MMFMPLTAITASFSDETGDANESETMFSIIPI
jgi:hypothetical protein